MKGSALENQPERSVGAQNKFAESAATSGALLRAECGGWSGAEPAARSDEGGKPDTNTVRLCKGGAKRSLYTLAEPGGVQGLGGARTPFHHSVGECAALRDGHPQGAHAIKLKK